MIVATEARRIYWGEIAPALISAYQSGFDYAEKIRAQGWGSWTSRADLKAFLQCVPLPERLVPGYFWCRGVHDGIARRFNDNQVETIIAAWFPDDEDKIAPAEVERFIAEKFPGAPQ